MRNNFQNKLQDQFKRLTLEERKFSKKIYENSLQLSEHEKKYLMMGEATELVSTHQIHYDKDFRKDKNYERAEIYGVVARDQTRNRYVWIYLYYENRLWSCDDLADACSKIEDLRKLDKLECDLDDVHLKICSYNEQNKNVLKSVEKELAA